MREFVTGGTVLKAENRSGRITEQWCEALTVSRSLVTLVKELSEEWWGRKQDCSKSRSEVEGQFKIC